MFLWVEGMEYTSKHKTYIKGDPGYIAYMIKNTPNDIELRYVLKLKMNEIVISALFKRNPSFSPFNILLYL